MLDVFTKRKLDSAVKHTKENTGLELNLAISYGSRQEIIYAINKLLREKNIIINPCYSEGRYMEIDTYNDLKIAKETFK